MEREKASTPTVEKWVFPESAVMSGYDGDHEDDDEESFMELNGEDVNVTTGLFVSDAAVNISSLNIITSIYRSKHMLLQYSL